MVNSTAFTNTSGPLALLGQKPENHIHGITHVSRKMEKQKNTDSARLALA
jgi:hypothetical protein